LNNSHGSNRCHFGLPRLRTCNSLIGNPLIIAGNAKHHLARDRVVHLLRQDTRSFGTVAPVLEVIEYVRGHDGDAELAFGANVAFHK
jgi:hypothetical protein